MAMPKIANGPVLTFRIVAGVLDALITDFAGKLGRL